MSPDRPCTFRGGPLSNFAPSSLRLTAPDGRERIYATVEHFFQAAKTASPEEHDRVADAPSPRAAKAAGRKVELRTDWERVKVALMLTALRAKFAREPF